MIANASAALEALGDSTRRAIFEALGERPMAVSELAAGLPVSRPAVSQHLRVLREAGLVGDRREGTRRIYALRPEGLDGLRRYLERFWERSLDSFAREAERQHQRAARTRDAGARED